MPGAVQAFADVNPVTLVVDAARALMIGDGERAGAGARDDGVARRPAARVRAALGARVPEGVIVRALHVRGNGAFRAVSPVAPVSASRPEMGTNGAA